MSVLQRTGARSGAPDKQRVQTQVQDHFEYVWRVLRRLGLEPSDADDAAQQVFMVLAKKIGELEAGKERSFLYGTAVRIAWRSRRTRDRRREELHETVELPHSTRLAPDQLLAQRQARRMLDDILESMPSDVRTVFVLFELEGLSLSEIAATLEIPRGTAASRLRRGREDFQRRVERMERGQTRMEATS